MNLTKKLAVVLIALGSASVAQADPIVVTNESDFLSLVGDVTTEGFEGYPTELCSSGGAAQATSISTSLLNVTTTEQGGGSPFLCIGTAAQGPSAGPRPIEGLNALIAGSLTGNSWTLSFTPSELISAVGFYLTDAAQAGDIFFALPNGNQYLMAAWPVSTANPIFFGFISDVPFSEFSLINTGLGDGWGVDQVMMSTVAKPVTIDIKPGSDPNCFNINGHGVIPVAVLGSDTFDVTLIDQATLSFGGLDVRIRGKKGPLCGLDDTNIDGFYDLVCHFEDNPDYWETGNDDATLTGALLDGTEIEGTDSICIVP